MTSVFLTTDTCLEERGSHRGVQRSFSFEASRLEEENCKKVEEDAWGEALKDGRKLVYEALEVVAGGLASWSTNVLGDLEKR